MEICQSRRFSKGVGHFERKFQIEGASPTNHSWCQKTRVIALSCGIKISAVHYLVTKHVTDRQTDRQNYDFEDRASIAASRGKNPQQSTTNRTSWVWASLVGALLQSVFKIFYILHFYYGIVFCIVYFLSVSWNGGWQVATHGLVNITETFVEHNAERIWIMDLSPSRCELYFVSRCSEIMQKSSP